MALLLDAWNGFDIGRVVSAFQAFPIIFEGTHGFNIQDTGISFLGLGLDMLCAAATQPFWNQWSLLMDALSRD